MNKLKNILATLCALLAAMFAVCGRNSPVNGKGRKAKKAPIVLVCLALLLCGGCAPSGPAAPIFDPDDLRQSCIEQQEYLRDHFPDGCRNEWAFPAPASNKQCDRALAWVNYACGQYVRQQSKEKEESKTWACAEGHSCR